MQRSRRLLFVLSPAFLTEKSVSLLECRLGLHLHRGHQASVVTVVYRSVSKLSCVEAAQVRQAAVSAPKWRGTRSEPRRSRFWLRLRLALPVRPLAMGRRLIDSTSSHSDLAALALQRAQRYQNQDQNRRDRTNQCHRDREEGSKHSRSCPGCAGFVGQVDDRGEELTLETEMQQNISVNFWNFIFLKLENILVLKSKVRGREVVYESEGQRSERKETRDFKVKYVEDDAQHEEEVCVWLIVEQQLSDVVLELVPSFLSKRNEPNF
ncbi:hypothetical protein F2P81_017703 [Scophthalmus maximus]|uniref:TIR domain-containing protein n=1 Tax=Scophthalmus maximus TaxID=52904 RepID=A0A6A4SKV0_SCOMX|nr:hypothetical protein F2P81_017703 [Scophthalmus maximus]